MSELERLAAEQAATLGAGRSPSHDPASVTTKPDGPVGSQFPLLSVADLRNLKPPDFLIDGMLPRSGFSVLYGPSGVGKSFLALDWAFCVAAGLAWYGNAAQAGAVLYIAAEGRAGLGIRAAAWHEARNQPDVDAIRFLPEPVNFLDLATVEKAKRTVDAMNPKPVLIVIDTMARSMVGGDENSARDVGLFIHHADQLGNVCDAARLVVHHTGKNGEDERGSSALRGAADMMHALKPEGAGIRLECAKAKDCEEYDPWSLHLGNVADSCILRLGSNHVSLSAQERTILAELSAAFGSDPATSAQLLRASGVPERSYYRAVKSLEDRGYVDPKLDGRSKRYTLNSLGRDALLPTTANDCQADAGITAATPPPLGGGSGSHHPGSNGQPDFLIAEERDRAA